MIHDPLGTSQFVTILFCALHCLPCSGHNEKLRYITAALQCDVEPFADKVVLDDDLVAAIDWCSERTVSDEMADRENIIKHIENIAAKSIADGSSEGWWNSADSEIRKVCSVQHILVMYFALCSI